MIPQQEIPGQMPSAFVMRHPTTGNIEVWWSPCPSRECPQEEEITIVVNSCQNYCLLREQNPKIEPLPHSPTKRTEAFEKKRLKDANITAFLETFGETSDEPFTEATMKLYQGNMENRTVIENEIREESWVGDSKKILKLH
jgi:hypothetical protein